MQTGARLSVKLVDTPLGWVCVAGTAEAVTRVVLPLPIWEAALAVCSPGRVVRESNPLLESLAEDLFRYFQGERMDLNYPVDLSREPQFRREVLLAARAIPYGEVRSYGWLAHWVGAPSAARAVGQALHHNPVPLLVPCHRVVGANGSLVGFGAGLALKRRLLELEGARWKDEGGRMKAEG